MATWKQWARNVAAMAARDAMAMDTAQWLDAQRAHRDALAEAIEAPDGQSHPGEAAAGRYVDACLWQHIRKALRIAQIPVRHETWPASGPDPVAAMRAVPRLMSLLCLAGAETNPENWT